MTLILTNDLDIYEHDLDTLKMYLHTKNEVYRPRLSSIKASTGQTDRQTDRQTDVTEQMMSCICEW